MYSRYFEAGLTPIPIRPGSKACALKGFNRYATEAITQKEVEEFEEAFPQDRGYGVGLLCGPCCNIAVIDIDSDRAEVLDKVPISPVRRRGKKGEARFFQFSPELSNKAFTLSEDENH